MSAEEIEDFEDWKKIVIRKVKRSMIAPKIDAGDEIEDSLPG